MALPIDNATDSLYDVTNHTAAYRAVGEGWPGRRMKGSVTIRDVARRAGVSYQTVSRLLNGGLLVSAPTRARIVRAMDELNYSPSAPARSIKSGRMHIIGVLIPEIAHPFFSAVAHGVEDVAYEAGYCVMVCSSSGGEREAHYLRALRSQRVAGVISTLDTAPLPLTRAGIPAVSVDNRAPGIDSVLLDHAGAAALAVDHLVLLGHRRVALITGPLDVTSGRGRLVGYRRALRRAGLPLARHLQATNPYSEEAGRAAMQAMLVHPAPPTAVIAASYQLTIGAIAAITAAGLRVPADVAVVGFDEITWHPDLVSPLTTVVQPGHDIGAEACRLLLERLTGRYDGPARRILFPGALMVRQSSGAALESAERSRFPVGEWLAGPGPRATAVRGRHDTATRRAGREE